MQMQNTFILGSSAIDTKGLAKAFQESQITFKIGNFKSSIAFKKTGNTSAHFLRNHFRINLATIKAYQSRSRI